MCANIGYPGPVTVAKAEFNGDVEGKTVAAFYLLFFSVNI